MPPLQCNLMVDDNIDDELFYSTEIVVKKQVRFELASSQIHAVLHVNDYSDSEHKDTWYSVEEYAEIKAGLVVIAQQVMKGSFRETDDVTLRGLENKIGVSALRRKQNKMLAITAVMDEQERQWELDIDNPTDDDLISKVYVECSAVCVEQAKKVGDEDAAEAKLYLESTEQPTSTKRRRRMRFIVDES